ncbi:MAG: DNA polymerase II large subunit [Candidatus Bathyarchaeia archaeon]
MQVEDENGLDDYFQLLEDVFSEAYLLASEARSKGLDPEAEPESRVTQDLAERVEKSVGPRGVAARIRDLSNLMPREEVAFKIAEEIVEGAFQGNGLSAADQAVRTALAILGEGVTVAPIQGIVKVDVRRNLDGTSYLSIYFAGPIRSAGGTEMALTLIVADFVRRLLGLDRYKATDEEAKRFVEELRTYERAVARFQYKFPDDVVYNAVLRLPVEVTGVETDPVEVSNFRNLRRIETNRVRGGALRVLNDGLLGRANKALKIIDKLGISGWEWLRDIKAELQNSVSRELMFLEDVIAGRPVFSFPAVNGGFRLRYGRARNTGLASYGVHPSTMKVLRGFIATGTQLRLEKPGKAGVIVPVDTVEPPIVRLIGGSVVRADNLSAEALKSIEKILFLGDILVGFGEFIENNKPLDPPGYVEEWWAEDLQSKISGKTLEELSHETGITGEKLESFIRAPLRNKPSPDEAFRLSRILGVPLHPCCTYFWELAEPGDILLLRNEIAEAAREKASGGFRIALREEVKLLLERLCIPHMVDGNHIVFGEEETLILRETLNPSRPLEGGDQGSSLEFLKILSGVEVRAKGGTFIGARMGRPEKAKPREMKPLVHCLFPVGLAGGQRRNLIEASRLDAAEVELVNRTCPKCGLDVYSKTCPRCGSETIIRYVCPNCGVESMKPELCPRCRSTLLGYSKRSIDLGSILSQVCSRLGLSPPELVKGVKGLTNDLKIPEPIEKGVLRAVYNLSVFKDGTVRFDMTNAVLTHFKPSEVGLTIDKALKLGYTHDYMGEPLEDPEQICALKPQDIIVSKDCGDYLLKAAKFIDELLKRFYRLSPFYKAEVRDDLIGHLVIGLSPHTSVGVVGRIIGYSDTNVCFAHPMWHAAKRRDCDGDEDSVSLVLDVLLNFSKRYLPSRIGGLMDAPLLITSRILPTEIARQAFNIEAVWRLPREFYMAAMEGVDSKKTAEYVELIYHRLCTPRQLSQIPFTHDTSDINKGNHKNSYSELPTMLDKVNGQLELADAIAAVDAREVARRVVSTHFMRDLAGNLKAYSSQKVRCKKCNSKYRRVPLTGKCLKCGGELTLTVYRGSIEKYLEMARRIVLKYSTGEYHEQRLKLITNEINSLFREEGAGKSGVGREEEYAQKDLSDFM